MTKYFFLLLFIFPFISSCIKGKHVDLIIYNAEIHTMNDANEIHDAMAIKDGKIVEVGPERQILNKYTSDEEVDAGGKDVYPGFTDAHGHILSLVQQKLNLDLTNSRSYEELLVRLEKYEENKRSKFIVGRGWDHSLWNQKEMPENSKINEMYPTIPVCLYRVDGHAILVNDILLKKAGITPATQIEGGQIEVKNGKCTGILTDNAILPVLKFLPKYSKKDIENAILEIQEELFQYGITSVHEAGINYEEIALFEKLVNNRQLKLNIYAMLYPSEKTFSFAKQKGIYQNKNLIIRSFKVVGDGALGSHGAFLKAPYQDKPGYYGTLTSSEDELKRVASVCILTGYQMNTHCIGDATNALIFKTYKTIYENRRDHRCRVEHAQVIDPKDFHYFGDYGIFPSVQPTHAVSDQRWAEDRLGKERLQGAYAYKTLLKNAGMIAIGTDFPIENIDPFRTIHAAVQRKDTDNFPSSGFLNKEALSLEECLKGMTIWAAFASFQETTEGTLEKGKNATFAIFESKITSYPSYNPNFAFMTFIKGEKVYSVE